MKKDNRKTITGERTPLLTVDEVCRYLKVDRRTVERLIAAGELPAFKVAGQVGKPGGCTRVAQDDLEAYLERKAI